jgi:hypothetical protein
VLTRAPLQFNPEQVVADSSFTASMCGAWVHENMGAHFTEIDDLAASTEYLSSALFIEQGASSFDDEENGMTERCCCSLVSRAVAACNVNPAPASFKQIRGPAIFAARRTARERGGMLTAWQLWCCTNGGGGGSAGHSLLRFMSSDLLCTLEQRGMLPPDGACVCA